MRFGETYFPLSLTTIAQKYDAMEGKSQLCENSTSMCANTRACTYTHIHLLQDLRNMIKAKTTYYSRKAVVENKEEKN